MSGNHQASVQQKGKMKPKLWGRWYTYSVQMYAGRHLHLRLCAGSHGATAQCIEARKLTETEGLRGHHPIVNTMKGRWAAYPQLLRRWWQLLGRDVLPLDQATAMRGRFGGGGVDRHLPVVTSPGGFHRLELLVWPRSHRLTRRLIVRARRRHLGHCVGGTLVALLRGAWTSTNKPIACACWVRFGTWVAVADAIEQG